MIATGRIISVLTSNDDLPAKGRSLISAANDAGGKDNITVVLAHNDKSPVQHEITRPLTTPKKNNHNGDESKIIETNTIPDNSPVIKNNKKKSNNSLVLFPVIIFLLGFLWFMFKGRKKDDETKKLVPAMVAKQRNKQELDLLDSINASSTGIVKLTGNQPIIITDSIIIKNDSLHIIGNGGSFVRDSAYTGPAFVLSSSCKYILLDSLAIENFNLGILVYNKGLHLKNVQFKNCLVPLQFQQQLSQNIPVSGKQAETVFYYTDSVKKPQ